MIDIKINTSAEIVLAMLSGLAMRYNAYRGNRLEQEKVKEAISKILRSVEKIEQYLVNKQQFQPYKELVG